MNCKVLSLIYTHKTFNRDRFYTRMCTTCTCALIAREKTKTMCISLRLVETFNIGFMAKAGRLSLKIKAHLKYVAFPGLTVQSESWYSSFFDPISLLMTGEMQPLFHQN